MVKAYEDERIHFCCNCSNKKFSPTAITALAVILFSFVLSLIIFLTPGWAWTLEIRNTPTFQGVVYGHYGMFYICWNLVEWELPGQHDCDLVSALGYIPAWWKCLQALLVFMLVSGFFALLINCIYICNKRMNENPTAVKLIMALCFMAGVFVVPVFIVFCVMFLHDSYWCCDGAPVEIVRRQLNYAFVIACCVGPFYWVGGFIAWLESRRLWRIKLNAEYHLKVQQQSERKRAALMRANAQLEAEGGVGERGGGGGYHYKPVGGNDY